MKKAKVFINGKSQAVRLPMEFRFKCSEVSVSRLGSGVVLEPISNSWKDLFEIIKSISTNDELFLDDRKDFTPQQRNYFK